MDSSSNLLILILIILAGAAHIRIGNLKERVDLLDPKTRKEKLASMKGLVLPREHAVAKSAPRAPKEERLILPPEPKHAKKKPASGPSPLWKWLSNDWPMKVGALLILLAFGWLTTYAFINNWIGPMGRIALGVGSGLLIMALGEWRIRKYAQQGAVFTALGAATVLVSLFAARNVYDFFTPLTALLAMFAVVVAMGLSSLRHKNMPLAIVGLLMGAAAPLLVNSPEPSYTGLFSYLLALTVGAFAVGHKAGWKVLNFISFAIVFLYISPAPPTESEFLGARILSFIFVTLFYASNFYSLWQAKRSSVLDVIMAIGNGFLALFWINLTIPEAWHSLTLAGVAATLLLASYLLFRRVGQEKALAVYSLTALLGVYSATGIELKETSGILALTWEAVAFLSLLALVTKDSRTVLKFSPLLLINAFMSLAFADNTLWTNGLYSFEFATLLSQVLVFWGFSYYLTRSKEKFLPLFLILGGVFSMLTTGLAVDLFFDKLATIALVYLGVIMALIIVLSFVFKDRKINRFFPLLLAPALIMSGESISNQGLWSEGIRHFDFVLLLGLSLLLWALGFFVYNRKEKWFPVFFIAAGLYSIALMHLSSNALYDGATANLAYTGVAVAVLVILHTLLRDEKISRFLPVLLIPPFLSSMESMGGPAWANGIWHTDFALLLSLTAVLLGLGFYFRYYKEKFALGFFILGGLYAMALTWLSSDALIENPNLHITVSLGVYTVAGLIFNFQGAMNGSRTASIIGGALIGFVILRLLFVDVWEMAIGAKVITFFLIGALLISTAFFTKKLSHPAPKKRKTR